MSPEPGDFNGKHFSAWPDTVKDLKRQGRNAEAIELLGHLVEATEADSRANNWGVAPWYYEQLAILHRAAGDQAAEIAILERFEAQQHAPGVKPAKLALRLQQARERAD